MKRLQIAAIHYSGYSRKGKLEGPGTKGEGLSLSRINRDDRAMELSRVFWAWKQKVILLFSNLVVLIVIVIVSDS